MQTFTLATDATAYAAADAKNVLIPTTDSLTLTVTGQYNSQQAYSNCCFVSPSNAQKLAQMSGQSVNPHTLQNIGIMCTLWDESGTTAMPYYVRSYETINSTGIALGLLQRFSSGFKIGEKITIRPFNPPSNINMSECNITIVSLSATPCAIKISDVVNYIKSTYMGFIFTNYSVFPMNWVPNNMCSDVFRVNITGFTTSSESSFGRLTNNTNIIITYNGNPKYVQDDTVMLTDNTENLGAINDKLKNIIYGSATTPLVAPAVEPIKVKGPRRSSRLAKKTPVKYYTDDDED